MLKLQHEQMMANNSLPSSVHSVQGAPWHHKGIYTYLFVKSTAPSISKNFPGKERSPANTYDPRKLFCVHLL